VHKVYEVCDLDDLSLDLIKEKLAKWEKREKTRQITRVFHVENQSTNCHPQNLI
jgi:hypothetical protein